MPNIVNISHGPKTNNGKTIWSHHPIMGQNNYGPYFDVSLDKRTTFSNSLVVNKRMTGSQDNGLVVYFHLFRIRTNESFVYSTTTKKMKKKTINTFALCSTKKKKVLIKIVEEQRGGH